MTSVDSDLLNIVCRTYILGILGLDKEVGLDRVADLDRAAGLDIQEPDQNRAVVQDRVVGLGTLVVGLGTLVVGLDTLVVGLDTLGLGQEKLALQMIKRHCDWIQ